MLKIFSLFYFSNIYFQCLLQKQILKSEYSKQDNAASRQLSQDFLFEQLNKYRVQYNTQMQIYQFCLLYKFNKKYYILIHHQKIRSFHNLMKQATKYPKYHTSVLNNQKNLSMEQNSFFAQNEKLYYQKKFPINNQSQRNLILFRQGLSIKNIPYFKIINISKNKAQIGLKKYQKNAIERLQSLPLAQKIMIIRQLFSTYLDLVKAYGLFNLCRNAFKIDESGKIITWLCENYQKLQFSVDTTKVGKNAHQKNNNIKSSQICKQFLVIFRHLLPHKKIRQLHEITCQQLFTILNQIQRKNQIHIKCHDIVKNKEKDKNIKRVTSLNKYTLKSGQRSMQFDEKELEKKLLKKSLNIFNHYIQPKNHKNTLSNLKTMKNNIGQRFSYTQNNPQTFPTSSPNKKISQPRWSHLQTRFNSPKLIITKLQKRLSDKSDKKFKKHEGVPKFLLLKNNPLKNQEQYLRKNIQIQQHHKINQENLYKQFCIPKLDIIDLYKSRNSKNQNSNTKQTKFNIRKNPVQVDLSQLKVDKLAIKFTSSITSDCQVPTISNACQNPQVQIQQKKNSILTNIRSCQNLQNNCIKGFSNSTSTAPSLKNCQSHQHFFLSNLNPLDQLRIEEELNQMFSSRRRKQSMYMQDDQQFGQLKQELGDLFCQ